MPADLAERIRHAAPDGGPPDHGAIRDRARVLRRRRRAARGGLGVLLLVLVAVPVLSRVVVAPEVVLEGRGGPPAWPLELRYEVASDLERPSPPVTVHELGGTGWDDWLEVSWPEAAVEGTVRRRAGNQVSQGTVPVLDIDHEPFASLHRAREAVFEPLDDPVGTPDALMSPQWTDGVPAGMRVVEDDLPELRRQVAGELGLDLGTLVARRIAGCVEPSRCFQVRVVALQGAHVPLFLERTRDGADLPELRLRVTHLRAVEAIEGPRVADTVVELPERGETEPAWLDDGTPVFVVHHEDGEVAVVEAISTHRTGADKWVTWCRSARTFEDPFHASEWVATGDYLSGPAPTGLPTYAVEVDGDRVRVGQRRAPTARGASEGGRQGPACHMGTGRALDRRGLHDPAAAPWPTVSPGDVPQHKGPMIVRGTLVLDGEGAAWVCREASGTRPRCPTGTPRLASAHEPRGHSVHTGTFLVTVDGERYAFARFRDVESKHFDVPRGQSYARPVQVGDGAVIVSAADITYGRSPAGPIPAGSYELRLVNRGAIQHTLTSEELGVDLTAVGGEDATTSVDLPPGEHVFFCRIPGHREAGMEFVLHVVG